MTLTSNGLPVCWYSSLPLVLENFAIARNSADAVARIPIPVRVAGAVSAALMHNTRGVLFETGASTLGGVQAHSSVELWNEIDPDHEYQQVWNRPVQVVWRSAPHVGEPVVTTAQRDMVTSTFDSCSEFAQRDVGRVLSEVPVSQARLTFEGTVPQRGIEYSPHRVVPTPPTSRPR